MPRRSTRPGSRSWLERGVQRRLSAPALNGFGARGGERSRRWHTVDRFDAAPVGHRHRDAAPFPGAGIGLDRRGSRHSGERIRSTRDSTWNATERNRLLAPSFAHEGTVRSAAPRMHKLSAERSARTSRRRRRQPRGGCSKPSSQARSTSARSTATCSSDRGEPREEPTDSNGDRQEIWREPRGLKAADRWPQIAIIAGDCRTCSIAGRSSGSAPMSRPGLDHLAASTRTSVASMRTSSTSGRARAERAWDT